jgi:hypothetical protein
MSLGTLMIDPTSLRLLHEGRRDRLAGQWGRRSRRRSGRGHAADLAGQELAVRSVRRSSRRPADEPVSQLPTPRREPAQTR